MNSVALSIAGSRLLGKPCNVFYFCQPFLLCGGYIAICNSDIPVESWQTVFNYISIGLA